MRCTSVHITSAAFHSRHRCRYLRIPRTLKLDLHYPRCNLIKTTFIYLLKSTLKSLRSSISVSNISNNLGIRLIH